MNFLIAEDQPEQLAAILELLEAVQACLGSEASAFPDFAKWSAEVGDRVDEADSDENEIDPGPFFEELTAPKEGEVRCVDALQFAWDRASFEAADLEAPDVFLVDLFYRTEPTDPSTDTSEVGWRFVSEIVDARRGGRPFAIVIWTQKDPDRKLDGLNFQRLNALTEAASCGAILRVEPKLRLLNVSDTAQGTGEAVEWGVKLLRLVQARLPPRDDTYVALPEGLFREDVYERAVVYAGTPFPVLIQGEPGTGKEQIARLIHERSRFAAENPDNAEYIAQNIVSFFRAMFEARVPHAYRRLCAQKLAEWLNLDTNHFVEESGDDTAKKIDASLNKFKTSTQRKKTVEEITARLRSGKRRFSNFWPLSASFNDNLAAAELFGYEEGAFSGARKAGDLGILLVASATSGTVFIDELGVISPSVQVMLLRTLQERPFAPSRDAPSGEKWYPVRPLGAVTEIPTRFRLLCATNRDLDNERGPDLERQHHFLREDFLSRVRALRLELPTLADMIDAGLVNVLLAGSASAGTRVQSIGEAPYRGLLELLGQELEAHDPDAFANRRARVDVRIDASLLNIRDGRDAWASNFRELRGAILEAMLTDGVIRAPVRPRETSRSFALEVWDRHQVTLRRAQPEERDRIQALFDGTPFEWVQHPAFLQHMVLHDRQLPSLVLPWPVSHTGGGHSFGAVGGSDGQLVAWAILSSGAGVPVGHQQDLHWPNSLRVFEAIIKRDDRVASLARTVFHLF